MVPASAAASTNPSSCGSADLRSFKKCERICHNAIVPIAKTMWVVQIQFGS